MMPIRTLIDWQVTNRKLVIVPLLVSSIISTIDSFEPGILWILIWFFMVVGWGVRLLFRCVRNAFQKNVVIAAQYLTTSLVGLSASIFMLSFVGDFIHLATMYPSYYQKIKPSPEAKQVFSWGGLGFGGNTQMNRALVYSPTIPPQFNEAYYRAEVGGEPPKVRVRYLAGSFYIQETWW